LDLEHALLTFNMLFSEDARASGHYEEHHAPHHKAIPQHPQPAQVRVEEIRNVIRHPFHKVERLQL